MNKEAIDLIFHYSKHYANILYECESLYEEGFIFVLFINTLFLNNPYSFLV